MTLHSFPHSARRTLRKCDKLTLKADFDLVRQNGKKSVSQGLIAITAPGEKVRCGIVCGKKYSLSSVVRNRARRLLWESFRLLKPEIAPCTIILIPRKKLMTYRRQQATAELLQLLQNEKLVPEKSAIQLPDC